ncbi:MAG: C39 family peptidase [Chloroflexi bacterium]|nr:C39 family peptidase [Chloroflexota bacterium]
MRALAVLIPVMISAAVVSGAASHALPPVPSAPMSAGAGDVSVTGIALSSDLISDDAPAASNAQVTASLHAAPEATSNGSAFPASVDDIEVTPPELLDVSKDLFASGTFHLGVPFRTQKDRDRFEGSNCGPAALAMVLAGFGMPQTNSDLRWRSHTYQGTVGRRGGTALQFLAMAAADFGIEPRGLYDGPGFRRWTVEQIRAELEAGRPVVPLVKYRLLPGREGSILRFDHYVVIYGVDGERFLYHDPAYAEASDGAARWMTSSQLRTAMSAAVVPNQAVAFGSGAHAGLDAQAVSYA